MMNGRFLLDANVVIAFFAKNHSVQKQIEQAEEVFVPSIVLGELYFGVRKSRRVKQNLEQIDKFASINAVLACDRGTAQQYGIIKNALRKKGRPIPENDLWIAAIAQQYDLILATQDEHFREVGQLKVETW